jgi:hypothetical protein
MKNKFLVPAALAAATYALFGCSAESGEFPASATVESKGSEAVVLVDVQDAKAHMARYKRSVVGFEQFETPTVAQLDSISLKDNFAVNADVKVNDDSTYTVASAGVDGSGFAWVVQIENGAVVYSWRESAGAEWHKFTTGAVCEKSKLYNIRVERAASLIIVVVNGKIVSAFRNDLSGFIPVTGKITIGFDEIDKDKCHCHNGQVDQIDFEDVDEIKDEVVETPVDTATVDSTTCKDLPKGCGEDEIQKGDSLQLDKPWIAEWDFNDSTNVGLDVTGNGHNAVIGEGSVPSVDGIATFDGASGFSVALDSRINVNEFVVEARVKPTKFGTMQNIIVAEPPGRGVDGWQLRIDEGVLTVHLRDSDDAGDDWSVFPGKKMTLGEWSNIRFERSLDSVKVFQDDELTVAVAYTGDLTQMRYNWSIGYDGMQQNFHDRYFIGEMDYIRFGKFGGFTPGVESAPVEKPLVAWEFNEPKFVGLDRMANNSTHFFDGNPVIEDSSVVLDGKSGLVVPLSKTFLRNTFAVETRVKPTQFGKMQNIIVAEPPGRYGDGWQIRLDDGVLTAHFRDQDVDDTTWNVYSGKALALDEWTKIRVERNADSIKVFQNDELTMSVEAKGDVSQLGYDIGIGYDAMMQRNHDRFFIGEIDYIRYFAR